MSKINIIINMFEHADDEKPMFTRFAGIVQTPIGDSVFYSIWVPALNESTVRIFKEDVRNYVIEQLKAGIDLNNVTIDTKGISDWTDEEIKEQWNRMLHETHHPENMWGL